MALPFPVMVPLPEVRNPISGTALTVRFLHFLARAHVQSRKSLGKRTAREALRTGNGIAQYRKLDHAHRVQFWYGTLTTTVPGLEEPSSGNDTK